MKRNFSPLVSFCCTVWTSISLTRGLTSSTTFRKPSECCTVVSAPLIRNRNYIPELQDKENLYTPVSIPGLLRIIAPRIRYSVLSRCSRGTGTTLAFIGRSELRGGANSVREQVEMLSIFGSSILERMFYYLNYPFINQAQYKVSLLSLIL